MRFLKTAGRRAREHNAWKGVSRLLGVINLALVGFLVYQSSTLPAYLVPYGFETANGPVKVAAAGEFSPEYLTYLAQADLHLLVDYSPDNVEFQTQRFLNRAAPELFASRNIELLAKAKDLRDGGVSQDFDVIKTTVTEGVVSLNGQLKRWEGEKLIYEGRVTYQIEYVRVGSTPRPLSVNLEGFEK